MALVKGCQVHPTKIIVFVPSYCFDSPVVHYDVVVGVSGCDVEFEVVVQGVVACEVELG